MSYTKAENVLPKELVEAIQQYVSGVSLYIPRKEKKAGEAGRKSSMIIGCEIRRFMENNRYITLLEKPVIAQSSAHWHGEPRSF